MVGRICGHRRCHMGVCLLLACFADLTISIQLAHGQDTTAAQWKHARELIRDTPSPGHPADPIATIRVVNCLRALGKDRAIALLREIAPEDGMMPIIDPSLPIPITYGDDQRVVLIIPLLFEVSKDGPPPPEAWYDKVSHRWCSVAATQSLQGGIPFRICREWTYGGRKLAARPLVEWAAEHGRIRDRPLEPQDDPLAAAEVLYSKIRAGENREFLDWCQIGPRDCQNVTWIQDDLRAQAISMLPQSLKNRKDLGWDEMRKRVVQTGVHWDRDNQAYVIGDKHNER